ncbi:hypothetical protein CUJ84_pRLN4000239 (plasmid) [Rhizobium leguminosarum]|uniref:Uncharacterized protein n=1 Tax=Rhizobium leguminosarum TaxID=384 RepID=A0A2K9ZI47_RHILE|nr:hypothetical protein CUJ84_pRLN4000239 [Rhizobium leguminosarum]
MRLAINYFRRFNIAAWRLGILMREAGLSATWSG